MARVPEWIQPMAATLTRARFTGPEWVFERKLDGIRVLAFKDAGNVRLLSRNRLPQDTHYPSFLRAVQKLPFSELVLDGEATSSGLLDDPIRARRIGSRWSV
jgi:bifunctional non-homologous end joining protein LigD